MVMKTSFESVAKEQLQDLRFIAAYSGIEGDMCSYIGTHPVITYAEAGIYCIENYIVKMHRINDSIKSLHMACKKLRQKVK